MVVLIAAAMPVRLSVSLPLVHSISILDILLILAAIRLCLEGLIDRRLQLGDKWLLGLVALPLAVTISSLAWSRDPGATARLAIIYIEGLVAYAFVVTETNGLPPGQVLAYMKRFIYLLIIPGVLLILHVPGFAPEDPTLSPASGNFLSYYSRLSQPILGRSNNLATVLAFFLPPLFFWGARYKIGRFSRAAIATFLAIILTFSRGVLLSLALAGLAYWMTGFTSGSKLRIVRETLSRVLLVVGLVIAAIGLFYFLDPTAHRFLITRFSGTNIAERSVIIQTALAKIGQSPLLGYGGGVDPDRNATLAIGVHDTYLQQILYYGVPLGLVVCLGLLLICWYFFAKAQRNEIARVLGFTVLIQLMVFAFESSYEGTVLKVLFFLSLGLGAGLLRAAELQAPVAKLEAPT